MKNLLRTGIALFALAGAACDPGAFAEAPAKTCTESGALCDLGGGPLGVCERARCAEGDPGPCFHCAPQH
jgi:hypothetical protein